jgi:HSP20 family protein
MSMMRYEPWSLIDQLRREMERTHGDEASTASDWVPSVDIKENADSFTITADIPGVDPKDIDVSAEDGVLTIKGERDSEKREEKENYKRVERVYGSFYRRFTLPDSADTTNISAKSTHGVLTITIPKSEKVQPRKISVDS